jgi:hypothetical protein
VREVPEAQKPKKIAIKDFNGAVHETIEG